MALFWVSIAISVYRAGPYIGESVFGAVAEFRADRIHSLDRLSDNFGTYSVPRYFCYSEFHSLMIVEFSIRFNILMVAFIAASVWSESTPRVLK